MAQNRLFWPKNDQKTSLLDLDILEKPPCILSRDCPPSCSCSTPKNNLESYGVIADCSNRDLSTVPKGLSVFTIELNLSNNNISFVPAKVFTQYHFLRKLDLANNRIFDFDQMALDGLTRLETLNISNNRIRNFSYSQNNLFFPVQLLQNLDMSNNQLDAIEPGMFVPTRSLVKLDLSNNRIERLPSREFHRLSLLAEL